MHIYICTAVSNLMPQESHQKKSISLKYKLFFFTSTGKRVEESYTHYMHAAKIRR